MADIICAWCKKVMGKIAGEKDTHGICDECNAIVEQEIDDYVNPAQPGGK